jgi:hypothetical protein
VVLLHRDVNVTGLGRRIRNYLEGSGVWDANRKISEHGEESVVPQRLERKIMGYFMYGEKEIMVRGAANEICEGKEGEGDGVKVAEIICCGDLYCYDKENNVFGRACMAHKCCNL